MSTSEARKLQPLATSVEFTDVEIVVRLADGRSITAPLEWFPRLLHAESSARLNWRLIGNGIGIHWEELDEDISVEGLLAA